MKPNPAPQRWWPLSAALPAPLLAVGPVDGPTGPRPKSSSSHGGEKLTSVPPRAGGIGPTPTPGGPECPGVPEQACTCDYP